jgi:hypothetical protein
MRKLIVIPFKKADGTTQTIKPSASKPGWASVMVMEKLLTINNGVVNERKLIGFVRMQTPILESLGLTEGCNFNEKFIAAGGTAHKVVVRESLKKAHENHQPKKNPQTGEILKSLDGSPIYYSTEVLEDKEENKDERIEFQKASVTAATGAGALA